MDLQDRNKLAHLAAERGLKVIWRDNGHVQLTGGPLLINYYPDSKRRSAYVAGTTRARHYVTAEQAVAMAFEAPGIVAKAQRNARNHQRRREIKQRLRKRDGDLCHWCHETMIFERGGEGEMSATIEHVIPLARGGLDNFNNMALSHKKCNHERGHEMPELSQNEAHGSAA